MKIPITRPVFGPEELDALRGPIESGWVVQGPKVAEFERLMKEYTGARFAIATTSCTSALHLALVALGVGPGDDVLVPSFTFVASANAIEYTGARPVFVDIDLDTFNVDVADLEGRLSPASKVIMPVSLFGLSADMKPILELAGERKARVIEDAACAIGAWHHGHHAGTTASMGCFSFHPRKAITTGEGGMILTNDEAIADQVRVLRDHGATVGDLSRHKYKLGFLLSDFKVLGYNYRMTDLQGSIGVAQMAKLPAILERRTELGHRYDAALADLPWLRTPKAPPESVHGYQSYVCLYAPEEPTLENVEVLHDRRNALMEELSNRGIATRQGTHAVHRLTYYRDRYRLAPEDFPNSYIADRLTMTLPLYPQMTDEEFEYVVRNVRQASKLVVE